MRRRRRRSPLPDFWRIRLLLFFTSRHARSLQAEAKSLRRIAKEEIYIYSTLVLSPYIYWRAEFHASRHTQRIIQVQAVNSAVQNWRSLNAADVHFLYVYLALKWSGVKRTLKEVTNLCRRSAESLART